MLLDLILIVLTFGIFYLMDRYAIGLERL